jgi:hypothetical protein
MFSWPAEVAPGRPLRPETFVRLVPILLKNSSGEHFGCSVENAISRPG